MKGIAALGALVILAGCATAPMVSRDTPSIELTETGLGPAGSPLQIDFGRAQQGVLDAVTALQGEGPRDAGVNGECGAGPVFAANWDNGLTLNFQNDRFLGWVVQAPFKAGYPAGATPLGTAEADLAGITLEDTTLGKEFFGGGMWHLVEEDRAQVTTVWSGLTCFFR